MAYIVPDSTIKILKDVGLVSDYQHSVYFSSASAQTTAFSAKAKYTLNDYSYIRESSNSIKVELKVADLLDCDYMMFQNTAYNNKWFYAFIENVEYINDNCSRITFEIDIIQTWFYTVESPTSGQTRRGWRLGDGYISRGMASTDVRYASKTVEPVCASFYKVQDVLSIGGKLAHGTADGYKRLYISAGKDPNTGLVPPLPYVDYPFTSLIKRNGVPGDGYELKTPTGTISSESIISEAIGKLEDAGAATRITGVFVDLFDFPYTPSITNLENVTSGSHNVITSSNSAIDTELGTLGRSVKNKKLYNSSCVYYQLETMTGDVITILPELLEGSTIDYTVDGIVLPDQNTYFRITNYQGRSGSNFKNVVSCPSMLPVYGGYDAYNEWRGETKVSRAIEWLNIVGRTLMPKAYPVFDEKQVTDVSKLSMRTPLNRRMHQVAKYSNTRTVPDRDSMHYNYMLPSQTDLAKGALDLLAFTGNIATQYMTLSGNVDVSKADDSFINVIDSKRAPFVLRVYWADANSLARIDDFYSKYGYSICEVKQNVEGWLSSRPYWNYIQTIDANVIGDAPATVKESIKDIFDSGITFWKSLTVLGDYSLNNSV